MANRSVRKYNKNKSKKMSIRRRTSKSKRNSKNHTKLRSKNLKRSRRNSRKTRHKGGSYQQCPPPGYPQECFKLESATYTNKEGKIQTVYNCKKIPC